MKTKRVFGIDLGTTYSCIAHIDEAGQPDVIPNFEGDLTTPSVVLFDGPDSVIVGREAKNSAVMSPEQVVEVVKRHMGDPDWRFDAEGIPRSPEEVSSLILRKLAEDAEQHYGFEVDDVVITCPAYFGVAERKATENAGTIAGLNVLEVINEPTAAAIAFGLQADKDQTVLVYDLGGGTFDVTMLEISEGAITVVATGGDRLLGGRDWDERLVAHLAAEWCVATGESENPRDDPATEQDLWLRAEEAKRTLSVREQAKVPVSHNGQRASVTVTRETFDSLTSDLLDQTVRHTRDLLEIAKGMGHEQFDQLLLVGGSTRMPQVAARLTAEFGTAPTSFEPDQAVAKGAAYYGQKLAVAERIRTAVAEKMSAGTGADSTEQAAATAKDAAVKEVAADLGLRLGAVQKMESLKVTNVASHSFGIVVTERSTGHEVISNLVLAQDKLPAAVTRTYYTLNPNQRDVFIQIGENAWRQEKVDLLEGEKIGTAELELAPDTPADSPVEVTFTLGADGQLTVVGKDLGVGGGVVEAVIKTERVLSQEEVAEARERSEGIKLG